LALVDIDRHILVEIITLCKQVRKSEEILDKHWKILNDCRAKQEALLTHLVSCVEQADTKKGLETFRKKEK